jgi:chlorobactene glucosyltransferase
MTPLLLALPWVGLLVSVVFFARTPSELPTPPKRRGGRSRTPGATDVPFVSVVVPARDEAINIVGCLRSIVASDYPDFEVIVVDDRSDDETGSLARSVPAGNARRVLVLDGRPLPSGWLGKPWACHQGSAEAQGDLLLFTDADTTHGEDLLSRAVAGRAEEQADLLTLVGRQVMGTFWERLVQPHIFLMMLFRFPDFERVARNDRWRDAIANGQYLLFTKSAYHAIDGHRSVQDEVVEDLALAQQVKRAGLRLRIRSAESDFATRMYRSLGQLIDGWSKNIVMGGLQSFPGWMRPAVMPLSFLGGVLLWLLAPTMLVIGALARLSGRVGGGAVEAASPAALSWSEWLVADPVMLWAASVYGVSAVLWAHFSRRMGVSAWYGLIYPLGASVGLYILVRSWVRGRNVEWKGRSYRLRPASERP